MSNLAAINKIEQIQIRLKLLCNSMDNYNKVLKRVIKTTETSILRFEEAAENFSRQLREGNYKDD